LEKEKSELIVAFAFATAIFDADSKGCIRLTIHIQNEPMLEGIITGQRRGVSPDIIIRQWECSICHDDFEKCSHTERAIYDSCLCQSIPRDAEPIGASLVDEPKDPRCRVNDLLVIRQTDKRNLLEWYGFELHDENLRFKDIAEASKKEFISQATALKLSELFSVNLYGGVRWHQRLSDNVKLQAKLHPASCVIIDSKWESLTDNMLNRKEGEGNPAQ
jgi:hypothetical protein